MAGLRDIFRKRNGLDAIPGFAGGTLGDQLDEEPQQPDPATMTRPRTVTPRPQASLRDAMGQSRTRYADPIMNSAQDVNVLQDKPLSLRDKFGMVAQNLAVNLGGTPLPTRRQRDIARAEGRLGQEMGVHKQQTQDRAIQSQADAREAAILAGQGRLQQGDERLRTQQDQLERQRQQDYRANLIRVYNGQADFDPTTPENAQFVAEWEKAFGYKPAKNVRGSQMATVSGYDAEGKPIVSIINKGNGTASAVTGQLPATTEGQMNRTQRQEQFKAAEEGRQRRFNQSQAGQDRRVGMRNQGGAQGGMTLPQKAAAERLVARYNFVRKQEMDLKTPKEEKSLLRKQREALGNQIYATYPGMFEEAEGGEIKAKAGQSPSAAASQGGSFDLGGWKAAHPKATEDEINAMKAKAKARNLAIVE